MFRCKCPVAAGNAGVGFLSRLKIVIMATGVGRCSLEAEAGSGGGGCERRHSTWGGILGANGKRVEERPMKDTENSPQDEKQGP